MITRWKYFLSISIEGIEGTHLIFLSYFRRDLVNQEARYSAQLEEAQKIILSTQTKVNDLQAKIDSLEKELSIKSWNVDRKWMKP